MHKRGDAARLVLRAQRAEQRHDDARAARADRMAERAGAAVHIDLFARNPVFDHRGHRHDRKRLVDLEQVGGFRRPAGLLVDLRDRRHGRGGEPARILRMRGLRDDPRERRQAPPLRLRFAHQDERRRAVVDRTRTRRGDRAVLPERRAQPRNLLRIDLSRSFVGSRSSARRPSRRPRRASSPRRSRPMPAPPARRARTGSRTHPARRASSGISRRNPRRTCPSSGAVRPARCRRRPRDRPSSCDRKSGRGPCGSRRAPSAAGTARWTCSPCRRRRRCRRCPWPARHARAWSPSCPSRKPC